MNKVLVIILFFAFSGIWAQEPFGLKSQEYYKPLEKKYQNWLHIKAIDKYLMVTGSDTLDGFLTFYLQIIPTTDDSAFVVWETLRKKFSQLHGFSLEEWLFKNFISTVKTRPELANLQISSRKPDGSDGDFYRGIYFENKQIKVIERNGKAKNFNPQEIVSFLSGFRSLKPTKLLVRNTKYKLKVQGNYGKQKVYDKITEYAENRFRKKLPDFQHNFYIDRSSSDILYFEVRNVKSEVFADEDNNFIAEFISWFSGTQVDWRTIEELHFSIKYIPVGNSRSFILEFDIDGRYGSGFHGINQWEKMFDMEKDFDPKLERYQQQFAQDVYNYLMK